MAGTYICCLGFDENLARNKIFPLAAAAYGLTPQSVEDCLKIALPIPLYGIPLPKLSVQTTFPCSEDLLDMCSAYTAISYYDQAIIVSFRGTTNFITLFPELKYILLKRKVMHPAPPPAIMIDNTNGDLGQLERYFSESFYSVWLTGIKEDLKNLAAQYPTYQLWVTGHSLGGAMASIAAAQVVYEKMWTSNNVKLITFGEPRVGNSDFADAYEKLVPHSYRVVHAQDPIPHIPASQGRDPPTHHRFEVWYNNNMTTAAYVTNPYAFYQLCHDRGEGACGNTLDPNPSHHVLYYNTEVSTYGEAGCPVNLKGAAGQVSGVLDTINQVIPGSQSYWQSMVDQP
jgi:hypothetical protein